MLRRLRIWIGLAISLLFIALLLRQSHPREVFRAIAEADFVWLLPAVAIFCAALWVRAVRYEHIIRGLKPVPAAALFPILVIGNMANNLLPLRMGELVRAYLLGERNKISRMASLGTGVTERLFDGLTCLAFLAGMILILGANGIIYNITLIALPIFALVLGVFIACLAAPDASERFVGRLSHALPERFRPRLMRLAVSFIEGLRSLRDPRAMAWVVATSILAWTMEAAVFWCVGQAFALGIPFGYYVMAVGAGNLALTAPTSPGGTGPFEWIVTQVLLLALVPNSVATAYAFTAHFTVLLPGTLLGLYYLWAMHLSLGGLSARAETAMDEKLTQAPAPIPTYPPGPRA